jgi:hypothetical protein
VWRGRAAGAGASRGREPGGSGAAKEEEGRGKRKEREEKKRRKENEKRRKKEEIGKEKKKKIGRGKEIGKNRNEFRKIRRISREIKGKDFCGVFRFFGHRRDFRDRGDGEVDRPAGLCRARDSRRGGRPW